MVAIALKLVILGIAITLLGGLIGGILVAAMFQKPSAIKIWKFTFPNKILIAVCGYALFFIIVVISYPILFANLNPDSLLYFVGLSYGVLGSFFGNILITVLFGHSQGVTTVDSGEIIGNVKNLRQNRILLLISSVILALMAVSLYLLYISVS